MTGTETARRRPRPTVGAVVDLAAVALLFAIAATAFGPVFDGSPGYLAAGGGVVLGLVVVVGAGYFRLSRLTTVAVLLLAYLIFGGIFALPKTVAFGVLPTLGTIQRLVLLTVQAWRDLLTVSAPASEFTGPAVVPFLSGLACSAAAAAVLRTRRPLVALLPVVVFLTVGILWGLADAPFATLQGVVFAVVALGWAAYRKHRTRAEATAALLLAEGSARRVIPVRGIVTAVSVLIVAALVAAVGAPAIAGTTRRNVLREHVVPPFDQRAYASPLTMYRWLVRDLHDQTVLTVSGLPAGARVRLAALDEYNGIVYGVDSGSAAFRRIGTTVSGPYADGSVPATLDVTVGEYSGVWIPGAGELHSIAFDDSAVADSIYYADTSGTAVATGGLASGSHYSTTIGVPGRPSDDQLDAAGPADLTVPDLTNVPDVVAQRAADLSAGGSTMYQQLKEIETRLSTEGFYSDGSDGQSRSGHTAERIATMLEAGALVGDDEQYAVAMALMARQLGAPARVVMGFYPDPNAPVATGDAAPITGSDAHVWVEVAFDDLGWVSFDPTPPRDRTTQTEVPNPHQKPKPQVLPPPEVLKEPEVPAPSIQDGKNRPPPPEPGFDWLGLAVVVGVSLLVIGLLVAPFLLIVLLKRRRSRRRRTEGRTTDRTSGGWSEIVDTATDLGVGSRRSATRWESAMRLDQEFPQAGATAVAERIDSDIFGQGEPSDGDVEAVWREVDEVLAGMQSSVNRRRRLRAIFSTRSLRARRRARKG